MHPFKLLGYDDAKFLWGKQELACTHWLGKVDGHRILATQFATIDDIANFVYATIHFPKPI